MSLLVKVIAALAIVLAVAAALPRFAPFALRLVAGSLALFELAWALHTYA